MPKYFDPMIEKGLYKFKYFFQPNPFKNIKSKNIYNLTPVFYMFISLSCFDNNDDEGFLIFRGVYSISTFNDFYRLFLSDRLSWILMDFDGFIQSS